MNPIKSFNRQIIFLRQLAIASKKIDENNKKNKEIENHIGRIGVLSKKKEVRVELEKLRSKIREVLDKKKTTKISGGLSREKIEEIEKKLNGYYKKTKNSRKNLRERIKILEDNFDKLKKKYPKKDLRNIKDKINLLKKRL